MPYAPMQTGIWLLRFTPTEYATITKSGDPAIAQFIAAVLCAEAVHLDTSAMINGVNYLVTAGVLQASRVAAILAPPGSIPEPAYL